MEIKTGFSIGDKVVFDTGKEVLKGKIVLIRIGEEGIRYSIQLDKYNTLIGGIEEKGLKEVEDLTAPKEKA